VSLLEAVVRERFVVHLAGPVRVERQLELPIPVEGVAGARDLVIAIAGAGPVPGHVGGVGGDLVSDDAPDALSA